MLAGEPRERVGATPDADGVRLDAGERSRGGRRSAAEITAAEDAALPRQPRTAFEFFAYAELGLRKALAAFRLIPDFAALSIANQMLLLQVLST